MRYEYGYRRMKSYIWCHRMGIFNVGGMGFGLKHLLTWDVALKAFPVASKQRITAMASYGPGGLNGKIICKWRDFPLPRLITGGHPIFWSLHCPCLVRDHIQNGVKKLLNVPNVTIADEVNYKHLHGILLTLIYISNIHDINSEFLGTCQSTHPTSAAYYTNSQRQCLLRLNLLLWEWCIVKGQRLPTTEHRNGTLELRNISAAKLC